MSPETLSKFSNVTATSVYKKIVAFAHNRG